MNIEFDNLKPGISNIQREDDGQLNLFDYTEEYKLPQLEIKEKTKKKQSTKQKQLKLDDIKTMPTKKSNLTKGLGVLAITGEINTKNSLINKVAEKSKEDIYNRNKELMHLREHPYIKSPFILTEAEKKLYRFLRRRLSSEIVIFSKVRLADIVNVNEALTREYKAFKNIALKHTDFAILSPDLNLICIVELDDYTHENDKSRERDQFIGGILRDCNIPLYRIGVRIDSITKEDTKALEFCVLEYMSPVCPKCGRPMEPKESKRKSNYGHRFYGCMGYHESGENKCTYTIDID